MHLSQFNQDIACKIDDINSYSSSQNNSRIKVNLIMTYDCNLANVCLDSCNCNNYCNNYIDKKIKCNKKIYELIKYLTNLHKESKEKALQINYCGGEPLLSVPNIIYIHDALVKNEIKLIEAITTNGTLLTDKMIENLINKDIVNYQITISVERAINEIRKMLSEDESLWKKAISGIQGLISKNANVSIIINLDNENISIINQVLNEIPLDIITSNKVQISFASSKDKYLNNKPAKNELYIDLQGRMYSCKEDIGILERVKGTFK